MFIPKIALLALAAVVAFGGLTAVAANVFGDDDDGSVAVRDVELRKDDDVGEVELVADDEPEGDGDDTRGNDGTRRGDNTGDRDDTRGDDGTRGGDNTGDGDATAGNDGSAGGDNSYAPPPVTGAAGGDVSSDGSSGGGSAG